MENIAWILFLIDSFSSLSSTPCHHVLPISHNLNKKYYAHTFLWNHPVLTHIWDLLSLAFTRIRNKHIVHSLKVISLKNINIQTIPCSFQDILLMSLIYCKVSVVWYSAPVGLTWDGFCLWPTIQNAPSVVGTCVKHRVMTNHQMGHLEIGKSSLFSRYQLTNSILFHPLLKQSRKYKTVQKTKAVDWPQDILNSKELIVYYWS